MTANRPAQAPLPVDYACPRHTRLDSLLNRVGGGDREAFAAMYDELGPTVYAMSMREGQEPWISAEVTQYVFLRAWRQARDYDLEKESAWAWIHAIAIAARRDRSG